MYIVTNREIYENRRGFNVFGGQPNSLGPHELRLVEVTQTRSGKRVTPFPNKKLTPEEKKKLSLPADEEAYPSDLIARRIFNRAKRLKKNLLLFVHGFNNNVESVVERALRLQKRFDVEVLAFSWPANGGGVYGALSYKSDKKDARASIGALDRVLEKVGGSLRRLRGEEAQKVRDSADRRMERDAETRDEFLARALARQCPVRVSLMLHSMGNYLFKQLLKSSLYVGEELLFDNVVMVAADANSENHQSWVDRVQFRNRLYITINENDSALKLSRAKLGSQQSP